MGKIRVKTLGDEEVEKQQKNKAKKRQESKKTAKAPGLKGGERVVAVGPTEEELDAEQQLEQKAKDTPSEKPKEKKAAKKAKLQKARKRSRAYEKAKLLVDRSKRYKLSEALELLPKVKLSKTDETVELHINTMETGIAGIMQLPHGTGKKTKIAVADDPSTSSGQGQLDEVIKKIEAGKIEFDILVAHPAAMPKLAKVAKILGPKGLMPNPKNGTITDKPDEVVKKFEDGQIRFKTETKSPVIHLTVGKLSFGDKKLSENIKTAFDAIQTVRMKKAVLKSTMSPGIKLDLVSLN